MAKSQRPHVHRAKTPFRAPPGSREHRAIPRRRTEKTLARHPVADRPGDRVQRKVKAHARGKLRVKAVVGRLRPVRVKSATGATKP
jgi:hypothetical protein